MESTDEESSDFDDSDIESDVTENEKNEKGYEEKGIKRWSELCMRAKLLYSEKKSTRLNYAKVVYSDSGEFFFHSDKYMMSRNIFPYPLLLVVLYEKR